MAAPAPGIRRRQQKRFPKGIIPFGRVQGQRPCRVWAEPRKRENPRNLRFLGRVQGQRPCRVWAEPSVTPRDRVTPRARTKKPAWKSI